jgi:oleate hydratase
MKARSKKKNPQLYIIGGGMAGLSAAVFAIRDAYIPGKNIHIFEARDVLGGSLYKDYSSAKAYITLANWKFTKEIWQCMWDVLSAIPSLTDPKKTVKDEIFTYNKIHRRNAKSRLIDKDRNRHDVTTLGLNWRQRIDILKLIFIPASRIENRRIDSWFEASFFKTNFWKVLSSMMALEYWHDLAELKLYIHRFMHLADSMAWGGKEIVAPYHCHDSIILPMTKLLREQGVNFEMGCKVIDLGFKPSQDELTVKRIHYLLNGKKKELAVNDGDYVFVTNGSMIGDFRNGTMTEPPKFETGKLDGSWILWENIAKKRQGLGNPSRFNCHIEKSKYASFTVTSKDPTFIKLYERFTGNKPGQADMVTFKDSNWHMSVLVPSQPFFFNQPEDVFVWGGYGKVPDRKGNYINIDMSKCSGKDILTEVCHQFGFVKEMPHILKTSTCIPHMVPYGLSHFLPRKKSDRPLVLPEGSTNLAFMGEFVESGEVVMTLESAVRCAKMAVYSLFNVNKKISPPYTSYHDPIIWIKVLLSLLK